MQQLFWLLTAAVVLSACTSSPAPTPSNPTPQPLVLDSFAANPNPSPINLGVQFSWSILGGGNKTCKLDVNNDGTFEYTLNACDSTSKQVHTYSAVGTYTAKLVVSDGSASQEKTAVVNVVAENKKPVIAELVAQQTANPLRVRWVFKVSDAEGDILTCRLDVNNDGEAEFVFTPCTSNALNSSISTANSSNPKTPSNTGGAIEYTYPAKGTYTARLEVSDLYNTISRTRSVSVPVQPEVLEFAANPKPAVANQDTTFVFKVSSPSSLPLKCTLTTGDGSTFVFDPCPTNVVLKKVYAYSQEGKFTATLTVQDTLGNTNTQNLSLNIAPIRFGQISAGGSHSCAIANNLKAYCWGSNSGGQLGNSNNTNANTLQAVTVPNDVIFSQINAGNNHTCALTSAGQAYCWGYNFYGQLGNGDNTDYNTPQVVNVASLPPDTTFSQISAGGNHTCALTSAGQAYCWGYNFFGQLGKGISGFRTDANTPQAVDLSSLPLGSSFTQISAGGTHTCALTPTGQAHCWGYNFFGQLGKGDSGLGTNANTPQTVNVDHLPPGTNFTQVSAGDFNTCALTSSGQAYCWGGNFSGQLGKGDSGDGTDANAPQVVLGGHTFGQISAGGNQTCALSTTHQAYCWGRNAEGQLGNGNNTDANTPQLVSGGHTLNQTSAGIAHTCALSRDNQAYCWGANGSGQLGNGNDTGANTPQAVVLP